MSWLVGAMRRWLRSHPVPGPPEDVGPETEREALLSEQRRLLRLRRSRAFRSPDTDEDVAWVRDVERRWQECQQKLADSALQTSQTQVESRQAGQQRRTT